ncbi:MAG: NusG domain II-containing protein [Clostridiales bacterium]|jgi:hypothetical protein|nr:NusG domain II-containing protein [Clostridiales bacterium]
MKTDVERIETVKKGRPLKIPDLAALLVILAAAVLLPLAGLGQQAGAAVEITGTDGETRAYDLGTDARIELAGLTVVIEGGRAYVVGAACPDKLCEAHPSIGRSGESIVCLPQRIVIKIVGDGGQFIVSGA